MSMNNRFGIFLGSKSALNLKVFAHNIEKHLSEEVKVDFLTSNPEYYKETVQSINPSVSRPDSLLNCYRYIRKHKPIAIMNAVRPPTQGNISAASSIGTSTSFICRFSADTYIQYQVQQGWRKPAYFAQNNVIGRLPLLLSNIFVVMGPTGRQRLISRGVHESDIHIIPPSVNKTRFEDVKDHPPLSTDKKVILIVGRQTYLKGMQAVTEIITQALNQRSDLKFIFIGPGEEPPIVRKSQNIESVGTISPHEMARYYSGADLLLHTSLTEGVPRVLLEALACGTPVLARDVGDVSFATKNTFQTISGAIKEIMDLEELDVDDIEDFYSKNTIPKYKTVLNKLE